MGTASLSVTTTGAMRTPMWFAGSLGTSTASQLNAPTSALFRLTSPLTTWTAEGTRSTSGPHEGNIMLYGRPVCDDIATPENAEVVCRQLGYLGGYITTNSFFGRVSSDFIMDEVNCNGTEEYIWRCPHDT